MSDLDLKIHENEFLVYLRYYRSYNKNESTLNLIALCGDNVILGHFVSLYMLNTNYLPIFLEFK
jgi:hypothetical protein